MASARNAIRALCVLVAVCAACATKRSSKTAAAAAPEEGGSGDTGSTFDITKLGATGDGKTDSTKVRRRTKRQLMARPTTSPMKLPRAVVCLGGDGGLGFGVRGDRLRDAAYPDGRLPGEPSRLHRAVQGRYHHPAGGQPAGL
jgi:hypothetical protein